MTILYKASPARGLRWREILAESAPDIPIRLWPEVGDPADIRFLLAWQPPERFALFPNLEAVFSAGAGVDQFAASDLPAHVPLVRMMEQGQVDAMVEYVTLAVLSLHRDFVGYRDKQRRRVWGPVPITSTADRRVGILGLGQMGLPVAQRLRFLGFPVSGWSRTKRDVDGLACFGGEAELPDFLGGVDILVCLLPLTAETRGILNARLFAQMPEGAALVNTGRGGHLVEADLLHALDSGHLSAAIVDVTDPEPPPADHPFWDHPKILMTPHIASNNRVEDAVSFVVSNIRRLQTGEPLEGVVDRSRGY